MIELQQWRVSIGTFIPPTARRSIPKEWKRVNFKGLSTWTLLFVLTMCSFSSTTHPAPHVNTLLQAGDIESNPGPGMLEGKEILAEIRSLRKEHEDHFAFLRNETSLIKSEMKNLSSEMEEMKSQLYDHSLDIDTVSNIVDDVQNKVMRLEDDMEKLERYSRRENIILYGILENECENTVNVKSKVVDLLNTHATDKQWHERDFVRVHRLGTTSTSGRPRPIIARLQNYEDKFIVLKARGELKVKGVGVSNDLTPSQRKELAKLRDAGKRGYYKGGKLCIDPNPLPPATAGPSSRSEQDSNLLPPANAGPSPGGGQDSNPFPPASAGPSSRSGQDSNLLPPASAGPSPRRGQEQNSAQDRERGRYAHGTARRQTSSPTTGERASRSDNGNRRNARGRLRRDLKNPR